MRRVIGRTLAFGLAAGLLAACDTTPGGEDAVETHRQEQFGTSGGLTLFSTARGRPGEEVSGITVNSYLWRASLDTIAFMPLTSADPFGGVIITDWYAPPESPDERFKATVFILDRALRADGVRATVFRQVRDAGGGWVDAAVEPKTATELEDAILTRARQLRAGRQD